MFEQIRFYLSHSFNDLKVNKRLTFFALLSVAAGVAAIVSLQTLAIMISNTLEVNLQENNRGDISIQVDIDSDDTELINSGLESGRISENTLSFFGNSIESYVLSAQGIDEVEAWVDDSIYAGQAEITYRNYATDFIGIFTGTGTGSVLTETETGNQATQLLPIIIDKTTYPFYSDVVTLDGQMLADVMLNPTDMVLGEETATLLNVQVGDQIQINGSSETFTLVGIVNVDNEVKSFTDFFAGVFGFYYLDWSAVDVFEDIERQTQDMYIQLTDPTVSAEFAASLREEFPYFETTDLDDLRGQNELLTEQIDTFVAVMGLISLLLGSIGIINTMQVIVRRRMLEVAVLKTIGLQSEQVTFLFLTEALLVGVIGSFLGVLLGWVSTFVLRGAVAGIFGSDIQFVLALEPAINGLVVGILVATVFGFLPTLTAGKVRPGVVLRPAQGVIPPAGRLESIGALLVIVFSVSGIVSGIIGVNFVTAFGLVLASFIAAGLIYLLLTTMIWLIGRFMPSLGIVDLKISLRQMLVSRRRGANTLLALVVGVFSLSTITLFAEAIGNILETSLEGTGGNVFVSVQNFNDLDRVLTIIDDVEGVNSRSVDLAYNIELVSYTDSATETTYDAEEVLGLLNEANIDFPPFFNGTEEEQLEIQQNVLDGNFINTSLQGRETFEQSDAPFLSGRDLTQADAELPSIVIQGNDLIAGIGVKAGDTVTYNIVSQGLLGSTSTPVTFEVVGVRGESTEISFGVITNYVPQASIPENVTPGTISVLVDIAEENVPDLRRELANVNGVFALETSIFTTLITSLLGAFTAFPTMVAILGLVVGGVVIANSVALATMERRHEIAVMKSVGLQRERVLGMLLLENGLLGMVGGLIGVGFGLVVLTLFAGSLQIPSNAIPFGTAFLLMMLCIFVSLTAAITSAWSASGEKPLTVLRYDA